MHLAAEFGLGSDNPSRVRRTARWTILEMGGKIKK